MGDAPVLHGHGQVEPDLALEQGAAPGFSVGEEGREGPRPAAESLRLAADGQLRGHRHEGFWECMDTYKDAVELNDLWAAGEARWAGSDLGSK